MSWSDKYKRSIDCDNPSGFSQKAHCAARKKRAKGETTKSKSPFNEMHQVKSHKTVEQIAKKHRLDVSFVKKQLEMGIPIEHEHTNDKDLATDIALQHLDEIPDYYTRLKKMESDAKKHHKKFKDVKEHCGCEDNAVQELETGLKKLDNTSYNSIDHLMRRIMKKHDMTAKQLHNAFVEKHDKTPDDWIKKLNEGTLHHWFKGSKSKDGKPGWVQADGSPCANEPGETKTPKCFSSGRLKALKRKGKKGLALIKSAVRRKRKKDKGQQAKFGGAKPTMVSTFAKGKKDPNYVKAEPGIRESMELNEASKDRPGKGSGTKDACYNKVKSRYDVWPSAYASGALVKCRKVGAANWGTKSEATEMIRYCPKCQKNETRSECKYGSKFWDMYSLPSALGKDYDPNKPHPGNFPESYDHEYSMARSELSTIISAAKRLRNKMKKGEGNIEAWVQSKITKAADYIDSAADYVGSGEMKEQVADTDTMSDKKPFDVAVKKIMNRKEKMTPTQRIIALRQAGKLQGVDEQMLPPINPESHKAAQRTQKLYNKGSRTDNPNEKEIFLKRTGPQLPLAKRKTETQVAHYEPEGEQIDESPAALALRAGLAAGTALTGMTLAKKAQQVGKKIEARNQETQKVIDSLKNSYELESEVIDEKCWPGYKKKGMKTMFGKRYPNRIKAEGFSNWRADFGLSEDWQKVNRQDKTDGLSQKAVNAYRRENPGSKLQTAVTEKNPEGKRANRRSNFCSRMSGMKDKLTSAETARDPDSRINKALRRWNCN